MTATALAAMLDSDAAAYGAEGERGMTSPSVGGYAIAVGNLARADALRYAADLVRVHFRLPVPPRVDLTREG